MVQAGGAAASHALSVVSAERVLGIFHERAVQALFTGSDTVTDAFNVYYGAPTSWSRRPYGLAAAAAPRAVRPCAHALAVTTAVAFVCFWLFPVAPPRLLRGASGSWTR